MICGHIPRHGREAGPFNGFRIKIFRKFFAKITRSLRSSARSRESGSEKGSIMKTKSILAIAAVCLALMAVKPMLAHHSFDAEYDSKKTTTISGYVTKLDWVNPHAFVFIDTKDERGDVKNFKIEMGP